jgi:hypothetical protein
VSQVKDAPELANRLVTLREPVVVTAPQPTPARRKTPHTFLVVSLVVLGIGLRAVPMASDRNLWIDEAMLALNVVERSASGLTKPLDWNQGAPVGYLMATKAAVEAFGPSAFALRFVAFAASVLGVIAFGWLVVRLMPPAAATFAMLLYAISPHAISYAAECKQYASDAALAIGLFAVSLRLLQGEGGGGRWVALALAGAVAVWFSHPSVFVLGGIGSALLLHSLIAKARTRFLAASATVGTWLVSFAICYVLFLKQLGQSKYLVDYWNGHFLPLNPSLIVTWLIDHYFAVFAYPGGLGGTEIKAGGIAAVLFAVGVWGFGKERWPLALALVLPAVLAIGASGVQKYPFSGRLLLFLVPLLVIGVARGAWMVGSALRPTVPFAAFALLGVLTAAPALETLQSFRHPLRYEQITPVLDTVRGEWQPGDRMYVYYGAIPAFTFYTRGNPFPAESVTLGTEARDDRTLYRDEIAAFKGQPRVWVVFSHRHKDEESLVRAYAESFGKCVRVVKQPGAAAYLFDFSGTTVAR